MRGHTKYFSDKLLLVALLIISWIPELAFGKPESRVNPRTFNGVAAHFVIENPKLRQHNSLRIKLTLRNSSLQPVLFYYSGGPFAQHIRVYDNSKKEIEPRTDAPMAQPVTASKQLAPAEEYSTLIVVDLWTYYELAPGKYYLRFYYDLRLLQVDSIIARYRKKYHNQILVPWDERYYPFSVVK